MKTSDKVQANNIVNLYFMFLGMGHLISWTAILNSLDYFSDAFPSKNINFKVAIAFFTAQLTVSFAMPKLSSTFSFTTRVIVSLASIGATLILLPFQAAMFRDTEFGFWLLMSLLFVLGFSSNLCNSSIIGLTSQLPGKYMTAYLIGSSFSGIFISFLRIVMTALFTSRSKAFGVTVYFIIAAALLIWCGALHMTFVKTPFYVDFVTQNKWSLISENDAENGNKASEKVISKPQRSIQTLLNVLQEIKFEVLLIAVTYIQKFTVFPGIAFAKPMPGIRTDIKIISMNFVFSIFFLLGKKCGQYRKLYNISTIAIMVLFRFALVAFFMAQAVPLDLPIINTFWFGYLNLILFGFTNGFVTCALFILAPEAVEPRKKEVAGFVSVLSLNMGILTGTFSALPFRNIGVHGH